MKDNVLELPIAVRRQHEVVLAAIQAMLYEVVTNPKPGLVDPVNNDGHAIWMFLILLIVQRRCSHIYSNVLQ